MDTEQLRGALLSNALTKNIFSAVLPANMLPNYPIRPALIIANTDESHKPGQHWIAIFVPRVGKPEFFNSFGGKPTNKYFISFLKQYGSIRYNEVRLQSTFSIVCGEYCAVFLYCKAKNIDFQDFLELFSKTKLEANDELIKILYSNYFQKSLQQGGHASYGQSIFIQNCKQFNE